MNNIKDFLKRPDGAVINTNSRDCMRARNRNSFFKKSREVIGDDNTDGKIGKLERSLKRERTKTNKLKREMEAMKDILNTILLKDKE